MTLVGTLCAPPNSSTEAPVDRELERATHSGIRRILKMTPINTEGDKPNERKSVTLAREQKTPKAEFRISKIWLEILICNVTLAQIHFSLT